MKHIIGPVVFAGALIVSPAYGQAWIGQIAGDVVAQQQQAAAEARCRSGVFPAPSTRQMAPIREGVQDTMTAYAALASRGTFNASSVFTRREQAWLGPAGEKLTDVTSITDPLLSGTGRSLGEPAQVVRAGDTRSAIARWIVRDEAGQIVGAYVGAFRRERRRWLLTVLEVEERSEEPPPLSLYCHVAGDLDQPEAPVMTEAAAATAQGVNAQEPTAPSQDPAEPPPGSP